MRAAATTMLLLLALTWTLSGVTQELPPPPPSEPGPGGDVPPGPPGPPPTRDGGGRGPMGRDGLGDMADKDVRELIETVRMVRLSKELGLDQKQTIVMVGQYEQYKQRVEKLNEERQKRLRKLKETLRTSSDDTQIQEALNKLIEQDTLIAQARRDAFEEVGQDLTAKQKAKLYVFLHEFDQDMRRLIQRARERGQGPGMNAPMLNRMREFREGRPGPFPQPGAPGRNQEAPLAPAP